MNEARSQLLGVLVRRAEQCASRERPYRPVRFADIEAALEKQQRRASLVPSPRTVAGSVPLWMIAGASRAGLGFGTFRSRVGPQRARRLLVRYLAVEKAFERMGDGLRFGELLALTQLEEQQLWSLLQWCAKHHVLVDYGERGWFRL